MRCHGLKSCLENTFLNAWAMCSYMKVIMNLGKMIKKPLRQTSSDLLRFCYSFVTREFLRLRMRNFHVIVFI